MEVTKSKFQMPIVLTLCAVVLFGCTQSGNPTTPTPVVQQKAPDTTLTGTVNTAAGKYFISAPGKPTTELDSYTVKLADYVGKRVSVTGQYSGTTLFVDRVGN